MIDPAFSINQVLRGRLTNLIRSGATGGVPSHPQPDAELEVAASPGASEDPATPIDVVVTANEINDMHGTGPLVKRLFKGRRNVFCIRAQNDWGVHDFGDWNVCIPQQGKPRSECFRSVLRVLGGRKVNTVVCVPFLVDELLSSIALQASFDAKLCVYLMDDQNVACSNIPDALMREFLERCSLRLATHAELRYAYERKYGLKFHILPAIVPDHLVPTASSRPGDQAPRPTLPAKQFSESRTGALIGSFWDQTWFDRTCAVLEQCDCNIDWYGNNKSPWLTFPDQVLKRAGIKPFGVVPEPQLAEKLPDYPFVIVPVGALDDEESNKGVAFLSLPGRILFVLATSHVPILIMGSDKTCGARFVRHFQVGEVAPYSAMRLSGAIDRLLDPENQKRLRQNAAAIGQRFSDRGIVDWLADSIERGAPADARFEEIFAGYDATQVSEVLDLEFAAPKVST